MPETREQWRKEVEMVRSHDNRLELEAESDWANETDFMLVALHFTPGHALGLRVMALSRLALRKDARPDSHAQCEGKTHEIHNKADSSQLPKSQATEPLCWSHQFHHSSHQCQK